MKLKRGIKPLDFDDIPDNLKNKSFSMIRIGDYIEVEVDDIGLVAYFRSKGLN